jgi:hypothetical protein
MNRYEAIIEALKQCHTMFDNGEFNSEEYLAMVKPLHEALQPPKTHILPIPANASTD